MKRILLLTVAVLCIAGLANAQYGQLGMYADTGGLTCNTVDGGVGLLNLYVVHTNTTGATAVEFACPPPACAASATPISWATTFAVATGNPVTGNPAGVPPVPPGASIAYGACLNTTINNILVGTAAFFGSGLTPACCFYPIIAHQGSGNLQITDCQTPFPVKQPVGTVNNTINGDATCPCGVTPTKKSTWGSIKATYTE